MGREEGGGAVSAVDVEPEAAAPGELGDGLEVIVAPRGRGAGVGDRGDRAAALHDGLVEGQRVVPWAGMEALVGGDRDRRVLAEAHDGDGPLDAVMARLRDQDGDGGFAPDALPPDVVPGRRLAGREQGGQVADRPAVREDAVGVRPEAGEAGHPADELSLHGYVHRPHLVDGRSVVQELPGEAAERGQGQRRGALMADIAGMEEVVRPGEDLGEELRERNGGRGPEAVRPGREHGVGLLVGHDARPLFGRRAGQEIGKDIDDLVPVAAEGLRVKGVLEEFVKSFYGTHIGFFQTPPLAGVAGPSI